MSDGFDDEQREDDQPEPPAPERVAHRLLVLVSVAHRALLERGPSAKARSLHVEVPRWLEATGVAGELEQRERTLLATPLGGLTERAVVDASWRIEGAAVLAWALGLTALPAHDEQVDPAEVARSAGFLLESPEILLARNLRGDEDLYWMQRRLLALHWRLRDFCQIAPVARNFREFSRTSWFGGFDLEGIQLVGDDLAIAGRAIVEAPPEAVHAAASIAAERHQAINWLVGDASIYSEVDTST